MEPKVTIELSEYESLKQKVEKLEKVSRGESVELRFHESILEYEPTTVTTIETARIARVGFKRSAVPYRLVSNYTFWGTEVSINKIKQQSHLKYEQFKEKAEHLEKEALIRSASIGEYKETIENLRNTIDYLKCENEKLRSKPFWKFWE